MRRPSKPSPDSVTFFAAVQGGDVETVKRLLGAQPQLAHAADDGPPLNCGGSSALHVAACRGHGEIERILVQGGADPNLRNAEGRTSLHIALEYNNSTREQLIDLGAQLDICAAARSRCFASFPAA